MLLCERQGRHVGLGPADIHSGHHYFLVKGK